MGSVMSTGRVLLPQSWLSTTGLLALAAAAGLGYLFVRALYALTLGPLASVPGPRLCAVSRIPYWVQVFRGRDIHWIHALHQRYGPVVRYGPGDLSFSSPQAWKDIHGHVKGRPTQPKAHDYGMQPANGVRSILDCDDSSHARVRRIFTPAFSDRALRQQEPIFKNYVELLVNKVQQAVHRSRSPAQLELTRYLNFVSFDVMAELCFGHPLGLLEKDEFSPWVSSIFELIGLLPISMFVEYYPVLSGLLKKFEPKWVRDTKNGHFRHSADRVDQRLREGTDRPDFWNLVVSKEDTEGGGLSRDEMHSNAEIFMMAGTETTATLLSGLLFQLCSEPRKLRLLAQEIRDNYRSTEDMTFDTLAKLPYLRACIKEGLRIYPPVPSGAPRVAQEGGLTIDSQWVPAGTRLLCTQYAAHRSAANFAEPNTFAPERWLPRAHAESDKTGRFVDDDAEAYLPFGLGVRGCIGKNMALHESKLMLAALLLRFDFELADESKGWMDQKAHALWVKQPLMCYVSLA